jgi:anaerobic magnesium-protoporphyrin IX monomethyl ester cyclase
MGKGDKGRNLASYSLMIALSGKTASLKQWRKHFMPKKILLVDAQGYWLKKGDSDVDQVVLPLGLMHLASAVKREVGDAVEVKIANSVVDLGNNDEKVIQDWIAYENPDIIGIRGITRYAAEFKKIAHMSKTQSSGIIIGGGPFVSSDDYFGLLSSDIDIAVIGEGEGTFVELVTKIISGDSYDSVSGVAFRRGSSIGRNSPRDYLYDLDSLPWPDYGTIDIEKYAQFLSYGYNKRRQGVLYTSRGCPYRCTFCHNVFGKEFRYRSPENIFSEIEHLYDMDIRDFYIVDDNFNMNKKRALKLFDLLARSTSVRSVKLYFVNGLRGDLVDRDFVDAAVGAGTIWLSYAIETTSSRLQQVIGKNLNIEKVRNAIEYSASKGVVVNYWGLLGIESETIGEARETVEFMNDLPPSVIPMLFSLKPYPGTDAYKARKEKGEDISDGELASEYHSFMGLLKKDRHYMDVLDLWKKSVDSIDRLRYSTRVLIDNGFTDEDIYTSYRLLYRSMSVDKIHTLVRNARQDPPS